MSDFFVDHSIASGDGANDGSSGTGAWSSFRHALIQEHGAEVRSGDTIWVRRDVTGDAVDASWVKTDCTLRGGPLNLIGIVRWPTSDEPDYASRPSMPQWDDDADVYPLLQLNGASEYPVDAFDFHENDCDWIRWRGLRIASGGVSNRFLMTFERLAHAELEDWHVRHLEGNYRAIESFGSCITLRDCEFGGNGETYTPMLFPTYGGTIRFEGGTFDQRTTGISLGTGHSSILMRNWGLCTKMVSPVPWGYNFVNSIEQGSRQHWYSRNCRHDCPTGDFVQSSSVETGEMKAIVEGEDHVPGAWRLNTGNRGALVKVSTPLLSSVYSIEATPDTYCGPFNPLALITSWPIDEFGGVQLPVVSGGTYQVDVHVQPSGWSTLPDSEASYGLYRGELWAEVETYIGSGSDRESTVLYSFDESQNALANDAWGELRVTNIFPSEDGHLRVRAFLGAEEGGAELVYVEPMPRIKRIA